MSRPATQTRRSTRRTVAALGAATLAGAFGLAALVGGAPATAGTTSHLVHDVSAVMPVQGGHSVTLGAMRSPGPALPSHLTKAGPAVNTWTKQATLPTAVVHDLAFPNARIGYAAAELGQVWKTTDGGKTWTEILNRGFPYYYYGVQALNRRTVVVSGFNDSTSQGILTWSHDGGQTWSADEVLSDSAWVDRVVMPGGMSHGLAMNGTGSAGGAPNAAWYTTAPDEWQQTTPDPSGGWFGSQFTLLRNHNAYASGITYCHSGDGGATWSCGPSVDATFDGATEFVNSRDGWVGGGEISPDVEGWVHRTTDGGSTWSDRVLDIPWPVRQIEFLSKNVGWVAAGNIYTGVGGLYYTDDGGQTWSQDLGTGEEMDACAHHTIGNGKHTRVWCIGYTSSFNSDVYRTTVPTP